MMFTGALFALFVSVVTAIAVQKVHTNATSQGAFMITSGLSSISELCLAVENGLSDTVGSKIGLVPCAAAIAAGDGRELFSMHDGKLLSVGNLCVSLSKGDVETGSFVLAACSAADDVFELEGSGQIKFGKDGQNCVSQRGTASGQVNLALSAAVTATSNGAKSHGAIQAVNGIGSFWASKPGVTEPVEFLIELGKVASLDAAVITWEFPAKSFSVLTENAGVWTEVFSTTVNSLFKTHIPLGGSVVASSVKIVMLESHPLHGVLNGHNIYGISSLELNVNGLLTVVEDCATAAKNTDCRDKYFLSYVGESDPTPAKTLRGESTGLAASVTSLAATTVELAEAVSKLDSCSAAQSFASKSTQREKTSGHSGERPDSHVASASALLKEARDVILRLRSALA